MKLVDLIHRLKDEHTKGITFYDGDGKIEYLSYAEIYKQAHYMLGYLQENNMRAGYELLVLLDNNREFIITTWACLLGGIICIPCQTVERSILAVDKFSGLCSTPFYIVNENSLELLQKYTSDSQQNILHFPSKDTLSGITSPITYAETKDEDIVMVLFSSGSISAPKGAAMSNMNLISCLIGYCAAYTTEEIFVNWLPFSHNAGIVLSHFAPVFLGVEQYVIHPVLMMKNIAKMMELVTEKKATVVGTIRMHLLQMTELAKNNPNLFWNVESLKAFVIGGEPLSYKEILEFVQVMKPFGLKETIMSCMYGLSETTSGVVKTTVGEKLSHIYMDRRTMTIIEDSKLLENCQSKYYSSIVSVGYPLNGLQIMIRSDNGTILGEDHVGTIYLKGKQVIDGYYGLEKGLLKDDEGWLNTEDVGLIHNRQLYIMGREKNMIFVNSKNVFCDDITQMVSDMLHIKKDNLVFVGIPSVDNTQNNQVVCFMLAREINDKFIKYSKAIRKICMENFGIKINIFVAMKQFPQSSIGKVKTNDLIQSFTNNEYQADEVYRYSEKIEISKSVTLDEIQKNLLYIFRRYCDLDAESNFFDYMHDSMKIAKIYVDIDNLYPDVLEVADLFQYFTVRRLSRYLMEQLINCGELI